MKYGIYSIKDHKFQFGEPITSPDDATAKRYFAMLVNNATGTNMLNFAAADYDLFKVGTFDSENGQVDSCWPVEFIVNGSSVLGD